MDTIQVAKVYANALLDISREENKIQEYEEELTGLVELVQGDEELYSFFLSPKVPKSKKLELVDKALKPVLSKNLYAFYSLLVEHDRIFYLKKIVEQFSLEKDRILGRKRVYLHSVSLLSQAELEEIRIVLSEKLQLECIIQNLINPSLIGGFILKYDDKVIDGSIKNSLEKLKKSLLLKKLQSGTFYEN